MTHLNRALQTIRTYHRLSQRDVAKKLGVGASRVCGMESGKRPITLGTINKYAQAFDISASEIVALAECFETQQYRSAPSDKLINLINWMSSESFPVREI